MARLGTIGLSRPTDHRGNPPGEAEFEAALAQLHELIEHESSAVLATVSEQRMRRTLQAQGWTVLTAPGHRFNAPGPDAIAWRLEPGYQLSVMILDNKATTRTGRRTVSKATGLRAPSLVRHLPAFIGILSWTRHPVHRSVRLPLERTLRAAQAGRRPSAPTGAGSSDRRCSTPPAPPSPT